MKTGPKKGIRWFHILLISLLVLLAVSLSPVYPARSYSSGDEPTLVALTFDDGYRCWTDEIMPTLAQYGLPATGYITDPEYREGFTWEDARTLFAAGWEIGWHTAKHIPVDIASPADITTDFASAGDTFESHGLPPPQTFAYPGGKHDNESLEIAAQYFLAARTMHHGINTPADVKNNPFHLKQFSLEQGVDFLKKKINKYSRQKMFLVIAGHTVGEVAKWQSRPDMTSDDFRILAEFLHEKESSGEIDVVTLQEGVTRTLEEENTSFWHLTVDSPFDTWFKFWVIPIPERYYIFYETIIQSFIGHRYPQFARFFDRY